VQHDHAVWQMHPLGAGSTDEDDMGVAPHRRGRCGGQVPRRVQASALPVHQRCSRRRRCRIHGPGRTGPQRRARRVGACVDPSPSSPRTARSSPCTVHRHPNGSIDPCSIAQPPMGRCCREMIRSLSRPPRRSSAWRHRWIPQQQRRTGACDPIPSSTTSGCGEPHRSHRSDGATAAT